MNLCLTAERKPGMRLSRPWWEKTALDILGIRAGYESSEGGGETGTEESEGEGEYDRGRQSRGSDMIEEPETFQRRSGG